MDLNTARELVQSKQIIYAQHEKEIERKIKILRKRADKHKDAETADRFRNKALEWETLLRANFWNMRKEK